VRDRINVVEDTKTISIVMPDGWTVEVIANDMKQDLETGYVSGVPGKRTRVCVTPRRDEPLHGDVPDNLLIGFGGIGPDFAPEAE
jgi:hypothetical protein